ncbi:polynucleotide 5'-hydroxyl-kinase NOL9 [Trichonephila clavipes]|nr:polynucleotide 5'-hydroxyl-kinase NOL9 [Trichonephila clavipes]
MNNSSRDITAAFDGSWQKRGHTSLNGVVSAISLETGISGRGKLTDNEISKLQQYYGLAIRRNINSVSDMFKAVWTIYFHKLSTDSVPQHGLCPTSPDTWCGFNKAKLLEEAYSHKHSLPEPVLLAIKPIFKSLSDKKKT